SSPAIGSDGTIYVGSWDKKLYAINPDGTEKWNFTTLGAIDSSPAISPDGIIYFGSYDNKLYAINPDGTENWNFTTGLEIRTSPAIDSNGIIYIGSLDNKLYAIYPNGTKKWHFMTGSYVEDSSAAIGHDGTIYVGSTDNNLYAINPDGTEKWTFTTGDEVYSSPAIGIDGTIYVGSQDNKLYAINPNGTEKWNFPTGDWVFSSPAIGFDGTIYVGSCDDKLYAINPDGTMKWHFTAGWFVVSSPAIGYDGTIYVGSHDKMLYAIGTPRSLVVNVTSHFTSLNSAAQSTISVHVTDGTNPVQGATVNLVSDNGGIFSPQSGITDANGDFKSIFNAPIIISQIICKISAEASKTGYNDGSGSVDVTINPIPWPMFSQNIRNTALSSYDTSTNLGKLKWYFTAGSNIHSVPAIGHDGTIYVGSEDHNLYAINPDGTKKWNFTTGYWVDSSPAIGSDGTIYVGSLDKKLYAISPDGFELWNFTTGEMIDESSPVIGSDGTIYIASLDYKLYAINPDGTQKWNFTTGGMVQSSPAISSDGTIYISSYDDRLYAINPDGTEKWSFLTKDNVHSSPSIGSDNTIYIGAGDRNLYALNPDGTEKWRFKAGGTLATTPAISIDGTIYIGCMDDKLYSINPDGSEKWNFTTGNNVRSSPSIGSDGTVYVGSHDHKIYAINPNGTEKWSFRTGFFVVSSAAIDVDGTIYIGSGDGRLYAFGKTKTPPIADAGENLVVNEGDYVQFNGNGSIGSAVSGSGQSYAPNPVALWHLDEGSGITIYDNSTNNNDGTIHGAFWTKYICWIVGPVLGFDGVDDYVEVPDSPSMDITNEITIDIWISIKSLNKRQSILLKDSETLSGTYNPYQLLITPDNRIEFLLGDGVNPYYAVTSNTALETGSWYHIVATYDGNNQMIYIFDALDAFSNIGDITLNTHNKSLRIGGVYQESTDTWHYPFNGYIDELVIYNYAVTTKPFGKSAEIKKYEWDFESDGIYDYTETIDNAPDGIFDGKINHSYGDDGSYKVTLRITDDLNFTDTDTCIITVQNVNPTVTIESITMEVEVGLRVAGRKYNNVSMTLFEDGNSLGYVSIERMSGSPDEQMAWIPVSINFSKSYNATVTYTPENPPNIGGNPVWIYLKSKDGNINRIHHTFNVQQSKNRDSEHWNHVEPWEVELNSHFIGLPFEITSHITDPGSDDEILTFTYGSQVKTVTYLNNPPNPDPYPSPEVNPVDKTDITTLVYEGSGTVTLVVKDDDNIRLGVGEGTDFKSVG
ncbi:MAG: outer membrane protein assembly factor BamB family protein, partial [Candidatus Kariarchaeaceae archaeon]